ncbi:hypothetical protein H5410_004458 [Solanum commersonii]|uniref:Uncharacterized protein n=1 Tax=Solanum commersonii TaxID=4109 RepID=A0A9J6B7F2_SOLCO|nr:hypothetical protein H5410_004458 [Solanum commersonii]
MERSRIDGQPPGESDVHRLGIDLDDFDMDVEEFLGVDLGSFDSDVEEIEYMNKKFKIFRMLSVVNLNNSGNFIIIIRQREEKQTPGLPNYLMISSLYNPPPTSNLSFTPEILTQVFVNPSERLSRCFLSGASCPDKLKFLIFYAGQ